MWDETKCSWMIRLIEQIARWVALATHCDPVPQRKESFTKTSVQGQIWRRTSCVLAIQCPLKLSAGPTLSAPCQPFNIQTISHVCFGAVHPSASIFQSQHRPLLRLPDPGPWIHSSLVPYLFVTGKWTKYRDSRSEWGVDMYQPLARGWMLPALKLLSLVQGVHTARRNKRHMILNASPFLQPLTFTCRYGWVCFCFFFCLAEIFEVCAVVVCLI